MGRGRGIGLDGCRQIDRREDPDEEKPAHIFSPASLIPGDSENLYQCADN